MPSLFDTLFKSRKERAKVRRAQPALKKKPIPKKKQLGRKKLGDVGLGNTIRAIKKRKKMLEKY